MTEITSRRCLCRHLIAHECVHTGQYERSGSVAGFLRAYFSECLEIGYPAAKLGDVVHRMLDRLPAGADEAEAKLAWDEALAHTESRLNADWVTRGLLPLPRTVRGYALKRILTIRSVLHSMPTRNYSGAAGGAPAAFREENLQSEDELLKGRADLTERYRTLTDSLVTALAATPVSRAWLLIIPRGMRLIICLRTIALLRVGGVFFISPYRAAGISSQHQPIFQLSTMPSCGMTVKFCFIVLTMTAAPC